jgi:hypothetical protein
MSWFERWSRRQDELAQGADADLVRDNRRRYRAGFLLLGFATLLSLLVSKVISGNISDKLCALLLLAPVSLDCYS